MVKSVPNLMRDMNANVQEAQLTLNKMNSKRVIMRHNQIFKNQG